jgi:hypothetical protein
LDDSSHPLLRRGKEREGERKEVEEGGENGRRGMGEKGREG